MINPLIDGNMEPLSIVMFLLVQIGGRFLKFDLTKGQEKLIKNNIVQMVIFFAIVLIATRSIITSVIVVTLTYISINVLFNENHKYNVLSKKWLHEENLIDNKRIKTFKDIYYQNVKDLLNS